ncbi:MAG: hypothetical protein FWG89_04170 [Treponema sp.]|nr:hypothetical protein [Treponema sp.]
MSVSTKIKQKARDLGFPGCGIIPYTAFPEYTHYLDERLQSFPDSKHLYEPLYDQGKVIENAKSLIVCTQRYNKYNKPKCLDGVIGSMYLFDNRLSYAPEYRSRNEFEVYLKTLGLNLLQEKVPSRWAAAKAGVGKFGRNNFIYDPEHGSYLIIHAWVTDQELDYDPENKHSLHPGCDEGCQRCVRACPTKALSGSFSMDRGACIAQLTFFGLKTIDEDLLSRMGLWLYGCDVCQDVCPLNQGKFIEREEFPLLKDFEEYLKPEKILSMDEDTYRNIINPRFWYLGEDNLWLWKCHALRIMVNSGKIEYHPFIKENCHHNDERIRNVALWGIKKVCYQAK